MLDRLSSILFPLLLAACVSNSTSIDENNISRGGTPREDNSISVLGATAKSGLNAPLDMNLMVTDLVTQFATRPDLRILSPGKVRTLVGAGLHDDMLAHYARNGRLAAYQIRALVESGLPTSRAMLVRLDDDETRSLPVKREPVLDERDQRITSREMTIYATRRTTVLSAMIIDLTSGRVVWTRQFQIRPETSNIVVEAEASDSDTKKLLFPPPVPLRVSVHSLLEKLVSRIP